MGNSLEAYRVAVGMFHCHTRKLIRPKDFRADTYQDILLTNLRCSFHFAALLCLQSFNPNANALFLLFVLNFILLIGNIESNPGPSSSISENSTVDRSITLCNLNIRSIRNKTEFLQNFAEDFDILFLTETHLDERIDNCDILLDSFSNRKDRSNAGGGLLIYAKQDIGLVRKSELENNFDETLWVEIHAKGLSFLVCNTYRPQWTDINYWTRLTHAIELAFDFNQNIVIVGDLNSNLLCTNNNKLVDLMNIFNLRNVIDKPTRITENCRTLLDPIILSDDLNCIYSDVINTPQNISDHDASIAVIECPLYLSSTFKREIWQYDKIDIVKFNDKLDETNWNEKLENLYDVDDMCDKFTTTFIEIARECIPTKEITIRSNDKPWFNNEIRKQIRVRERLRKKVLRYHRETDIQKYKKQRNKVNNMKKIAKENFENNLDNFLLDSSSNSKTYWKIMKMLIKSSKGTHSFPPLQNIIDEQSFDNIVVDEKDKCELMNKYFSMISKLDEENKPLPHFETKTENSISDIRITEQEIIDVIQILDTRKASGPDKISHKMLKFSPEKIAKPLYIIFNKSLEQSKYPSSWKIAHVTAILKKGDDEKYKGTN